MTTAGFYKSLKRLSTILLFIVIVLTSAPGIVQSQSFDYDRHPKRDFDFLTLTLDLGLQPQNLRLQGAATYTMTANIAGADTLSLHASHLDISNVEVGGESADYNLKNDSLFIVMDDSATQGDEYKLKIRYSGQPRFGLLKNAKGTAWTSQLPKSKRHWLPILDNPNATVKTTLNISVPTGLQVWATGQKTKQNSVSDGVVKYTFESGRQIPATDISFAVGHFNSLTTTYGIKKINLATEQSLADSLDSRALLQKAYDFLSKAEDRLQQEYPYNRLNIIVTSDHNWETKTWSASTIYLYSDLGNLDAQLVRGVIGQWFGAFQRPGKWRQSDVTTIYQTLLAKELMDKSSEFDTSNNPQKEFKTVYHNYSAERWNRWQQNYSSWQNASVRSAISDSSPELLKSGEEVVSWQDYAGQWYKQTGQPVFDLPVFPSQKETESVSNVSDSTKYDLNYTLNESNGKLRLRFRSRGEAYSKLVTLKAYEVYNGGIDTSTVTFTGAQDSVVLKVDPLINTIRVEAPDNPELVLNSYKPVPFLLYDLRNGQSTEEQAEAARKLGYYRDNEDIQLAIKDVMNKDQKPKVEAALIASFADITDGATGTQQVFLDAIGSQHNAVKLAGLHGLANFSGDSTIASRVKRIADNSTSMNMYKEAVPVLQSLLSEEEFAEYAKEVSQKDTAGRKSIVLLEIAAKGGNEEAIGQAESFINDSYNYVIRQRALMLLMKYDDSSEAWNARAKRLLNNADPRIRFLTVKGLIRNGNSKTTEMIRKRMPDEYDARVRRLMNRLLQ